MNQGDRPQSSGQDPRAAEAVVQAALRSSPPAGDIAAALEAIGDHNLSLRRRLQAELLHRRLADLAELAARCGFVGSALANGGRPLVEHDGVRLNAEPGHFRTSGRSPAEVLVSTLESFALRPRVVVDLQAGAGEIAILLARRFPKCRVIAVEPSRERLQALDANLALLARPLDNLEISPPLHSGTPEDALRAMAARGSIRRIDLLLCRPGSDSAALAAAVRAMPGGLALACVTLSGEAENHADLLTAFEDAGLVLLEKRSQPAADPRRWLAESLSGRSSVACWFASRRQLKRRARAPWGLVRLIRAARAAPPRLKAAAYGALGWLEKRADPAARRFELERLYSLNRDPWLYLANDYEVLKYRRTLRTALRLRPGAGAVLEIGCSIGVFTRMAATAFPEVTAVDLTAEALKIARRSIGRVGRVSWVRSDIRRLALPRLYDLIFCAEMLYYLPETAAPEVLKTLHRHLAPGGLVMMVMPRSMDPAAANPRSGWERRLLEGGFRLASEEDVDDPVRAYLIQAFERDGTDP